MNCDNNILVLDDDLELLAAYRRILQQDGNPEFKVTTASQGKQGVELVRDSIEKNRPFAVAIIDIRMPPGIDGLETARKIRDLDSSIFIVLTTAYNDRSIEEIQRNVRHDVVLARKPIANDELIQQVRNACNQDRLRLALSVAAMGSWQWNVDTDQCVLYYNLNRILGRERKDTVLSWRDALRLVHIDDRKRVGHEIKYAVMDQTLFASNYRIIKPDGTICWLRNQGRMFYREGKPRYMLGAVVDVSKFRQTEEALKSSLKEKEALVREVHHRVKNNMQVIIGLLRAQSSDLKKRTSVKAAQEALDESQNRIRSMSLIHERLYRTDNMMNINFPDYIKTLVRDLFFSYGIKDDSIVLDLDIVLVNPSLNQATPCGLIINELVSNSLKYAFSGKDKGCIRVALEFDRQLRMFKLEVADNGRGFPEGLDWMQANSLGLRLVRVLSTQINGEIEIKDNNGICFQIRFGEE